MDAETLHFIRGWSVIGGEHGDGETLQAAVAVYFSQEKLLLITKGMQGDSVPLSAPAFHLYDAFEGDVAEQEWKTAQTKYKKRPVKTEIPDSVYYWAKLLVVAQKPTKEVQEVCNSLEKISQKLFKS
ncbi:MAG: hypothetical protein Q7K43_01615 [Candidatus Woesearchaeota archaeon]|nr:hypothetical protein [Candidatus Woesearchaeota archaeon]